MYIVTSSIHVKLGRSTWLNLHIVNLKSASPRRSTAVPVPATTSAAAQRCRRWPPPPPAPVSGPAWPATRAPARSSASTSPAPFRAPSLGSLTSRALTSPSTLAVGVAHYSRGGERRTALVLFLFISGAMRQPRAGPHVPFFFLQFRGCSHM